MATRNTPTTSTLEEWRVEFNELATDIGNVTGSSQGDQLTTSATDIVGAINELETNFNAFVASSEVAADNISTGDGAVNITTSSGNITIDAAANNTDIIFKGTDATADITMLTLDGSEAGAATFNSAITGGGLLTTGGNIVIPDAGNIGSASDTNAITISSGGVVAVTATTASSNSTTGALTVGGGAGVAADLSVGDDLRLISDASVLSFGADSDVTLTHVADTGILLNSTMAIQFNDASQYINAPTNAILDINATDEIELNATLADINANLDVSGTYTGGGLMTTGGNIVIPNAGNIGSASDTDAIAIASTGIVTFSQNPVGTGATNNMIINGDMVVAQRGITITDATVNNVSTTTNADDSYTLDRWILVSDGDNIVDVTQQHDGPDGGSTKSIRLDVETIDKQFGIVQWIEHVNCHEAIGQTVSLSFKMKVTGAKMDDVRAAVVAWSSTRDAPTSDIVATWQSEGTVPTLASNVTYENTAANLSPTTSWATYTIENVSVDTSSTENIGVFIWSGVDDTDADNYLYITDVQLESGVASNPFIRQPIQQTMLECERYYESSMEWGEDSRFEGQPPSFGTGNTTHAATTSSISGKSYRSRKRVTPTTVIYDQNGLAGAVYTIHDAVIVSGTVAAQHLGDYGFTFATKTNAFNQNYGYYYGYTAEAEL